jgi:hypothetical protein
MDQLPKIIITPKADQALDEMLKIVNDDFSSGRVKKTQLASWIVLHFKAKTFTKQLKKIRVDHFDKLAHLKSIVKQMEEAKRCDQNLELAQLLSPLTTGKVAKLKIKTKATPNEN